ncbi:hypothetical protein GC197_11465 [bacterium]|nr:hypothetical protein [bacterium]
MAKNIRSGVLALAVIAVFCTVYHSSLGQIIDLGNDWLRRQRSDFCHPGYQLHSEYCLTSDIGQRLNVYVFESSFTTRDTLTGEIHRFIQIMAEDENGSELHRICIDTTDSLMSTTAFPAEGHKRLELAFQTDELKGGIYCKHWRIARRKIVPADLNVRETAENLPPFLPNACCI